MHHDLYLGRYQCDSPLFQHPLVVSSPGARVFFFLNPTPWDSAGCSNSRLQSHVRSRAHCEYENGYLVFDRDHVDGAKEVWRLASEFTAEGEVAAYAPPDNEQMDASARAAGLYHQYAPRGQFRPWALLRCHELTRAYRLVYPTFICASYERAFLHDVRTGSLVQTIDIRLQDLRYVDVNEHHAFVCDPDAVHVFSRESGTEVLRIPANAAVRCSQRVEDPFLVSGDWFITPLSVYPEVDEFRCVPEFIAGVCTHILWFTEISYSHLA